MEVSHATGGGISSAAQGPVVTTRVDAPHALGGEAAGAAPPAGAAPHSAGQLAAAFDDESPEPQPIDILVASAGLYSPEAEEQLREEARQLSAHLQASQRALDAREAHLHAQLARVENEVRVSRLWLRTREDQLRDREAELLERASLLAERETESETLGSATEASLQKLREQLGRRQEELHAAEERAREVHAELEERARRVAEQERRMQAERAAWEAERTNEDARSTLLAERLNAAEAALRQTQSEWETRIAHERADLATERDALADVVRAAHARRAESTPNPHHQAEAARLAALAEALEEREARLVEAETQLARQEQELHAAQVRRREAERETAAEHEAERARLQREAERQQREAQARRESLDRQHETIAARRATLEQLHGDLSRLHREALEMRLVSEELWAKLAGRVPPAELTRAVAETRSRLCEHFRVSEDALVARQEELAALAERLEGQQRRIAEQRRDVQTWAGAQQAELERQAACIAAREEQLTAEQHAAREREAAWSDERRALLQEIRRLRSGEVVGV